MPEDVLSLFNFEVHLSPSGGAESPSAPQAAFSEVQGLEFNVEVRELREGGYNEGVRRLVAKASHPNIVLKRGVSTDRNFWEWVQRCTSGSYPLVYFDGAIVQYDARSDRDQANAIRYRFVNGVVTKVRSADLNAAGGTNVPIEEMHIAHEGLTREAI